MYTVQCSVYSVQYSVYSVQYSVFSVQYSVFSIQFIVLSVQCTVFSVQCTVNSILCAVSIHRIQVDQKGEDEGGGHSNPHGHHQPDQGGEQVNLNIKLHAICM